MQTNLDIQAVRHAALYLHRVLIQAVRLDYERTHGHVDNPTQLWQLVLTDPKFAWLRPLSQWIVELDDGPDADPEAQEAKISASDVIAAAVRGLDHTAALDGLDHSAAVRGELETLLSNPEWNEPYLQLLQEVPEVVLAHAKLQHELQRLPSREPEPAMFS
ncbi:MAG TPA: hypothetical protein VFG30_40580 [Polyangiales bacterium]|nr:hypothetical protein [Polyangiales bacterium]